MFDHILTAVQQHDLQQEKKRLDAAEAAEAELKARRKQAGLLSMSDYQQWVDGAAERETEQHRPAPKEQPDVDVSRPGSSARFPPPPRRA